MTPVFTVNLLRVLFVTFCGVVGSLISSELLEQTVPGLLVGVLLGMMLAMRSNRDEFSLIIPYVRFTRETAEHEPLLVDTSAIIDGRIAELCATGFLSRALIVPRFVLTELQALADSREPVKRERGR